jgi:small-conductance mechanosensitive channel
MDMLDAASVESLTHGPTLWLLLIVTSLALGFTWILRRASTARALVAVQRWIPLVQVAVWTMVGAMWLRRLLPDDGRGLARGAVLLVLGVAALPWLRNVVHGVVFGLENRFRIGDDLRVGEVEGRLSAIGAAGLVLRASDGTEVLIPHARLATDAVVRLNLEVRDAPCEMRLAVPPNLGIEAAMELARTVAALSPHASPRCAPQVFLVTDGHGAIHLRLRGFVSDRDHAPAYRSDVGARFMRVANERGGSPALWAPPAV